MSDLERWLAELGLERYAKRLAENDVSLDVLADLSDADLAELGLSLGHRRKLLSALHAGRLRPSAQSAAVGPASGAVSVDAVVAERRQITVLFCDLVGSTELANRLDPEDLAALLRRYQDACSGAVARYEGFVAKFMGDGVLAYFGYPQANEDAAERAVRSALEVVDAVAKLDHSGDRPLAVRVGIATGVVVIGDMAGTDAARERSIAGDTPNLAARLQALAGPNEIRISVRTRKLLGERFDFLDLGTHVLKGYAEPVQVWRVLRAASTDSRFAATRAARRSAFVGRGDELAILLDHWQRTTRGEGQALVIYGEAGMGKSRLADVLAETSDGDRRYRVTCQCSPYHVNSALYPVINHLERAAGFTSEDDDEAKLAKLEALLRASGFDHADVEISLIADLLALPVNRYPAVDLPPPQRKVATLAALVEVLLRVATDAPVLLMLEDAHWIDPTTADLWARLIGRVASTRMLVLVTARPDFVSPWAAHAHLVSLELARLSGAQASQLASEIALPNVLQPAIVDDIVAKSDGVPLFVEELTRAVLESSSNEGQVVPATLHDSLMARLDRLGPAKDVAQVAAVIGQRFSPELLAAIITHPEEALAATLQRLVDAGIATRGGRDTQTIYTFRHALLRDVAYENLSRARRQQLHEQVACALVERFAVVAESQPELLAHHFHHARQFELARVHGERAGDRAVARSSFAEAIAHFSAALEEASQLPEGCDRTRQELALLLKLGPSHSAMKGFQNDEVAEVYRNAERRASALGDEDGLFKATWGLWTTKIQTHQLDRARDQANALISLARKSGNDDYLLEGFHCLWSTGMFRGDVRAALEVSREGIRRYERERHSWMGPVFGGHDPGVCAHVVCAVAYSLRGQYPEAKRLSQRAVLLGESLRHPNSHAHALISSMIAAQVGGDHDAVRRYGQTLIALAEKYNLPPPRAHAAFLSAYEHAIVTDLDAGLAAMEDEFPRASVVGPMFRYYSALLAEVREKAGHVREALTLLEKTIETVTEPGVGLYISELYRLQGLCLLRTGGAESREAGMNALRRAVDVADRQGAMTLKLRAAMSLARGAIAIGQPAQGDDRPAGVLRIVTFAEFDPVNLREANRASVVRMPAQQRSPPTGVRIAHFGGRDPRI